MINKGVFVGNKYGVGVRVDEFGVNYVGNFCVCFNVYKLGDVEKVFFSVFVFILLGLLIFC